MLALALILAVAVAGAIVGLVYLAKVAVAQASARADVAGQLGQRVGELELAAAKVTDANAATSAAAAAEQQQAERGDALEKELTDEAAGPPRSTADRLQVLADAGAAAHPGSGSDPSRPE